MLRGFASFPLTRLGPDDVVAGVAPDGAHLRLGPCSTRRCARGARIVTLPRFELEAFLAMVAGAPGHRRGRRAAARARPWPAIRSSTATTSRRCGSCSSAPRRARPRSSASADARLGCAVGQSFGMTELARSRSRRSRVAPWRARAAGARASRRVVVDPDSGARLGAGRPGELWLRGPALMRRLPRRRDRHHGDDRRPGLAAQRRPRRSSTRTATCSSWTVSRSSSSAAAIRWLRPSSRPSSRCTRPLPTSPSYARPDEEAGERPGGLRRPARAGASRARSSRGWPSRGALQAPDRGRRRRRDPAHIRPASSCGACSSSASAAAAALARRFGRAPERLLLTPR